MNVREFVTNLKYKVDDSGRKSYQRGIDAAKSTAERFRQASERGYNAISKAAGRAGNNSAGAWRDAHGRMRDQQGRFVKHAQSNIKKLESAYTGLALKMGKQMAIGGLAAGTAVVGGAAYASKQIFDVGKSFESQMAALETVTGSQAKANKEFARLELFAKKTPFNLEQVIEGYTKLTALGLDPSERAMKSYGNTAGAMGKDLMQMVEAVADASTGEFERLKEFGIRASKEGDRVKFTFQGVETEVGMNSKEIQEYLLKLGETKFAGGMEKQAATIGGKMSSLQDTFEGLARKIWEGGMKQQAHKLIDWVQRFMDKNEVLINKMIPQLVGGFYRWTARAFEFAKEAGPRVLQVLNEVRRVLPFVIGFFGTMAAYTIGLKTLYASVWLVRAIQTVRALTWSTILLNSAAFAIPVAIGVLIGALGYVFYQVYKYVTQGEKGIEGLRKKFPAVADLIVMIGEKWKAIQPYVSELISRIWSLITLIGENLAPVFEWVFVNVIVRYLAWTIKNWITIIDWIRVAVEYWIPVLKQGFEDWKAGMEVIWTWLEEKFGWLFGWLEKAGRLAGTAFDKVASLFGGEGGATAEASDLLTDSSMASKFIANASRVQRKIGQCYNAVWTAYRNTFGGVDHMSKGGAESAYMAAAGLARDPRFREIKVTPEMLQDPEMQQKLKGAIAVFNQRSGYNPVHGHIETWDPTTGRSYYGVAGTRITNDARKLANARVFVPVQNDTVKVPMNGAGTPAAGPGANVTVHQVFGPAAATPAQVKEASKQGVNQGLNKAAKNTPRSTS